MSLPLCAIGPARSSTAVGRRGARTALIATEGFRDVLDVANESRCDQYDLTIEKPKALVPWALRLTVPERVVLLSR
jgi:N-methylhydantoinase A